jgi:hypothetical protein
MYQPLTSCCGVVLPTSLSVPFCVYTTYSLKDSSGVSAKLNVRFQLRADGLLRLEWGRQCSSPSLPEHGRREKGLAPGSNNDPAAIMWSNGD